MGDIAVFTDPPLSISCESSSTLELDDSVETLDISPSPSIALVTPRVVPSLALISTDRGDMPSAPAETLYRLQNLDGSSPSMEEIPTDPTSVPSPVDYPVTPQAQFSHAIDFGNSSPDDSDDASGALSASHQQRRSLTIPQIESDNDPNVEQTDVVSSFPPQELQQLEPTGVGAGLWNLGNTCFMNSIMQCFTHTVPLIESLCSYQTPCNCGSEFCVMQDLRDHIALALRSSGDHIAPVRFVENLNYFSPCFQKFHQEDAHEFLQSFLDKLERCCLDSKNQRKDANIVEHVFGGRLISRLYCCNCDSVSDTYEPSLGLSLEIEDVDDILSALESFTRVEKLEDKLTCDNCMEKVYKEKQLVLDKLPHVATFHLKRFKNDGVSMEKIFKHVMFPLELDMQPYMSGGEDDQVSTTYQLYAFVQHYGSSLTYGHYTSYVRSAVDTWHEFDDSRVSRIEERWVESQNAYILFYVRKGTPWFSSIYEHAKSCPEADALNRSPKSVLDPSTYTESPSECSHEKRGVRRKTAETVDMDQACPYLDTQSSSMSAAKRIKAAGNMSSRKCPVADRTRPPQW